MTAAWRIVKRRHASNAFDGEGARLHGARWNSPGTPVVYLAETRALALLEVLAGMRSTRALESWILIGLRFEPALAVTLERNALPVDWRESPPPISTQRIGDAWASSRSSLLLRVPSVVVPAESNYLLNPLHPDFPLIEIGETEPIVLDARLLG